MILKVIKHPKWNSLEAPTVTKCSKLQEFVTIVKMNTGSVRKHYMPVLFSKEFRILIIITYTQDRLGNLFEYLQDLSTLVAFFYL